MIAGLGDDGPAVAVADQDHRPAHRVDCGLRVLLVVGVRGLGGLCYRHHVPIILEDLSDGFPARTVGESSMHQNHILDCHCCSPFSFQCFSNASTLVSRRRSCEISPLTTLPDGLSLGFSPAASIP